MPVTKRRNPIAVVRGAYAYVDRRLRHRHEPTRAQVMAMSESDFARYVERSGLGQRVRDAHSGGAAHD